MTTKWVPFTAYFTANQEGDKRFEKIRNMQKIAVYLFEGLADNENLSLANPSGGQQFNGSGRAKGGNSSYAAGCGTIPKFGQAPAQLSLTGFYKSTSTNTSPHPVNQLISSGTTYEGNNAALWENNQNTTINSEVLALKTIFENAIDELPGWVTVTVNRINYSGILFGNRGIHFPS